MICPYCAQPLKPFGKDTFYLIHKCVNKKCPAHKRLEFHQPADMPDWQPGPATAEDFERLGRMGRIEVLGVGESGQIMQSSTMQKVVRKSTTYVDNGVGKR